MFRGIELNDRANYLVCDGLSRANKRRETIQCRIDQQGITMIELEKRNIETVSTFRT